MREPAGPAADRKQPPSSACTSASTIMISDAANQAMIAEGPATVAAVSAPNSHPEPMIDPSDAHSSPRNPTPRSIPSAFELRLR